jgi:hypothetical protein
LHSDLALYDYKTLSYESTLSYHLPGAEGEQLEDREKIKPQLKPLMLSSVGGSVLNGSAAFSKNQSLGLQRFALESATVVFVSAARRAALTKTTRF